MYRCKLPVRYWGFKPGPLVSKYIEKYSCTNEIVLDPFGGSGSIVAEALRLNRRAIYIDINPYACLIAKTLLGHTRKDLVLKVWNSIRQKLKKLEDELFSKYCPFCNRVSRVKYYIWYKNVCKAILDCKHELSSSDIDDERALSRMPDGSFWYENGKPFRTKGSVNNIREMYTKRTAKILVELKSEISELNVNENIKNIFLLAFANTVIRCSKMERYKGALPVPCYWFPAIWIERNPLEVMEWYIKRILCNLKGYKVSGEIDDVLTGKADVAVINYDSKKLDVIIKDRIIDLVVTDPPFFDEIQYLELSYIINRWLGYETPFGEEIVINYNRGKTLHDYLRDMSLVIKALINCVKQNRHIIIMIHEEEVSRVYYFKNACIERLIQLESLEVLELPRFNRVGAHRRDNQALYVFICKNSCTRQ